MKDHDIALLVNELTAIARAHSDAPNLQHRIQDAVLRATRRDEKVPHGDDVVERQRFAEFMVRQGFGAEAVAPPAPPHRSYRSSQVELAWESWCGALASHGLEVQGQ